MEKLICPSCKKEYLEKIDTCSNCNFPFNGTEKEKAIHIGQFINKKGVLFDSADSIGKSQKILYAITLFNVVAITVRIFMNGLYWPELLQNGIITLILFLCAFFLKRNPILLTLIPLVLLIGVYTLNSLIDPNTLLRGIFIKLIIIGSLCYSIYLIKSADRFKRKYGVDK
ncbi:MAG: hypothetical protein R2819_00675 [Allomuricauda sp.]